jgi:hypothetical protein
MQFFNVLEKKCYRYRAAAAMIFSKTYRDRSAAAMTFSKTCRDRAAMDISDRGMDQHHPAKILDRFLKYGSNLNSV